MPKGSFEHSALKRFHDDFKRAAMEAKSLQPFKDTMEGVANQLVSSAKKRTPVGPTGELRRGFHHEGAIITPGVNVTVDVVNNVEYAQYVEEGHRTRGGAGWVPGEHMLRLATREIEREFNDRVLKQYTKVLTKAMGGK